MRKFTISLTIAHLIIIIFFLITVFSTIASAMSIESVSITPFGDIAPTDNVNLTVQLITPYSEAFLYQDTEVVFFENEIYIDFFVDDGMVMAIGSLTEVVSLGQFNPGVYEYYVHLNPAYSPNWGVRDAQGTFTVTPEPISSTLFIVGGATLGFRRFRNKFKK